MSVVIGVIVVGGCIGVVLVLVRDGLVAGPSPPASRPPQGATSPARNDTAAGPARPVVHMVRAPARSRWRAAVVLGSFLAALGVATAAAVAAAVLLVDAALRRAAGA